MLINILPGEIKVALSLSIVFWIFGAICAVPFLFFGFDLIKGIKLFLLINPFIIFFLTRLYLNRIVSKDYIKEGWSFGLFLAITHFPLDILFVFLFFKEALIVFKDGQSVLIYGEFILFSFLAGLFLSFNNKKIRK